MFHEERRRESRCTVVNLGARLTDVFSKVGRGNGDGSMINQTPVVPLYIIYRRLKEMHFFQLATRIAAINGEIAISTLLWYVAFSLHVAPAFAQGDAYILR